jgi:ABC-2 type transport system permease protein
MGKIFYIIEKEFIQLFRNRVMLRIIIMMPVVQLFVLAYAATFEIKNIRLYIVDNDRSQASRELTGHFTGSPFYTLENIGNSYELAEKQLLEGGIDQVLVIPFGFEKELNTSGKPSLQLMNDAINGSAASLMNTYSLGIIRDFNRQIISSTGLKEMKIPLDVSFSYWYNPELDYINYMVPGILVVLVTVIGMLLSGMNLVREKEIGTIEQINVSPINKIQFITGKLIPYWIIAVGELAFGLVLAKIAFDIPMVGSVLLVFAVAAIYLLVMQGMGLFISTVTNTQQQAMFLAWFILLVFILMSGLFTPVESMPGWAQKIVLFNPIAYFIEAMRMILLKGSHLTDVLRNMVTLLVYALVMLILAVWRYRKVA